MEYIRVNDRRYPPLFVLTSDKIRVNEGNDLDWKKGGRNRSRIANRHINTANTVDRPKLLILLNLYIKDIYKKCHKYNKKQDLMMFIFEHVSCINFFRVSLSRLFHKTPYDMQSLFVFYES